MVGQSKKWFNGSADLKPLTERNKVDLTVASSRNTIQEELGRRGAVATRATGTVIVVIEKGQVKGSRWMVTGNLGPVWVSGEKLGLSKAVEASIDMSNLTDWEFPTDGDTRTNSNQSAWRDGSSVTTILKDGTKVLDDPSQIKDHAMLTSPGFSLRLTVAPGKGGAILIWLSVAPMSLARLKTECEARDLGITSPFIPTYGAKLPASLAPQTKYETSGSFIPQEKGKGPKPSLRNPRQDNLEANWGLYPMLQKVDTGLYPTSDAVYKEFSLALRCIAGHNNRKNAKALYAPGKQWEHTTVWNFDDCKLWPEPSMSISEPTATGKTTSPLVRVSGCKYGLRGGYGKQCLSPKLPDKLAKVLVEAVSGLMVQTLGGRKSP